MVDITQMKDTGFMSHNGLYLVDTKENYVKIGVDITEKSLNPFGIIHGGLIYTLADSAMGIALATSGRKGVTINSNIDYLNPGKGTKLFSETEIIKDGKNIVVLRATINDENNTIIAISNGTYYILNK